MQRALLLFAAGTLRLYGAALVCLWPGHSEGPSRSQTDRGASVLETMSMVFGMWYAFGALGLIVYPLK
jgi:hypothetical protein